jgi:hypothetical protein
MIRIKVFLMSGEDKMMIEVMLSNGAYDRVPAKALNRLLRTREIVKFLRADGWVEVGQDPIRGMGRPNYGGPDRRARETSMVQ